MPNKIFRNSINCKICNSPYMGDINRMIINKTQKKDIMKWIDENTPDDFSVHSSSLYRHRQHAPKDLKLVDLKPTSKPPDLSYSQIVALTNFLDLVIEKVDKKIKSGKLKPTVSEAIKAAEIKAKIKEQSKFEKDLINFIMGISGEHGYSNQA